jgi:hypothetical protein
MPRYVIERQFLVPMYEHIVVQAPSLEDVSAGVGRFCPALG